MKVALTETGKLVKAATAIAKGRYYCPQCHRPLRLCAGHYRNKYFAHVAENKPKLGSEESRRHKIGKTRLRDYFMKLGLEVQTEYYFPSIKRRGDVVVRAHGEIYVIEYQCSPITVSEIRQRTYDYQQVSKHVYWIAGPQHCKEKGLLATMQKFGRYATRYGWWFLAWDALADNTPWLFYQVYRQLFGKITYLKQPLLVNDSKISIQTKPNSLTNSTNLIREVRQLERHVLGTKIDQRYLKVQQLCYEKGHSLLGCPWVVHVPQNCTDFWHLSPPILNRICILLMLEEPIGVNGWISEEVDQEFWNYLVNHHWIVKREQRWQFRGEAVTWFPDASTKMNALKGNLNELRK